MNYKEEIKNYEIQALRNDLKGYTERVNLIGQELLSRLESKPQASELSPKLTSQAVCQRCWNKSQIQKDCPDCKGTGRREP